MNILSDPIHQDELIATLKDYGNSFVDEESRVVSLDYFIPVFVYKYGGLLSNWTIRIMSDEVRDYIHCENVSGMKFVFPIYLH